MVKDKEKYSDYELLTKEKIDAALAEAIDRIKKHMPEFTDGFPAEASINNVYPSVPNRSWTESFYTGMLWLCYEETKDENFRKAAERQLASFKERIEKRQNIDTHDLGFLYTLSCVAANKPY